MKQGKHAAILQKKKELELITFTFSTNDYSNQDEILSDGQLISLPYILSMSPNKSTLFSLLGISTLFFAGVFLLHGYSEESLRMNIRWSAKFSLVCFCLAFGASSIASLIRNSFSNWLVKNRRYLGISFALIHLVHLALLLLLHRDFNPLFSIRSTLSLALGGLAYLFLVLMLLTSFEKFASILSKSNWNRLHTIGGYWILAVFSFSILARVFRGQVDYIPLGILVVTTWILRLITWKKRRV